jgi:GNAT superfamily N-acetyltransferase
MIRLEWPDSTTDSRYRDVLAIRREANVHDGKLLPTVHDEDLADEFDRHARIALLSVDESPAGTVRICLAPEGLPCDLARLPGYVEVAGRFGNFITGSRMAVLPAFQGRGLFWRLHELMPEEAEKAGRGFVLGTATGWVLEQYVKAGWERTGHAFAHPDFRGYPHEFIFLDVLRWRRRREYGQPPGRQPKPGANGIRSVHISRQTGDTQAGGPAVKLNVPEGSR